MILQPILTYHTYICLFFIKYQGGQDEIETSYEEARNRIQKTFDTTPKKGDSSISLLTQEEGEKKKKKRFHDARIPFPSLDLGGCLRDATGICMIPENWTAPRLTGGIYSTVRSRRCTLVEKYMPPSRIVYESSPGVEGKLDYRRSNTESDQIARKGLHPSSLSVQRRRLPVTHAPPPSPLPYNSSCWLQNSAFCRQITGRRHPDAASGTRSNHINRGDRRSIVPNN